jgi:hypothetical protein
VDRLETPAVPPTPADRGPAGASSCKHTDSALVTRHAARAQGESHWPRLHETTRQDDDDHAHPVDA